MTHKFQKTFHLSTRLQIINFRPHPYNRIAQKSSQASYFQFGDFDSKRSLDDDMIYLRVQVVSNTSQDYAHLIYESATNMKT